IAGAGRHFIYPHGECGPIVRKKYDVIHRAGGRHGDDRVAFADARTFHRRQLADALDPAIPRQDNGRVFADGVRVRIEIRRILLRDDPGPPAVAQLLADFVELALDEAPELTPGGENGFDARRLRLLLFEFHEDFLDFHLSDAVELGVQDGFGLDFVEP